MSSEEMRIELERFVNTGLREGWTGWPRHDGRRDRRTGDMGGRQLSQTFTDPFVCVYPCSSLQLAIRAN